MNKKTSCSKMRQKYPMEAVFTRQDTTELISLLKEAECLWNVNSDDYRNRSKKELAYHTMYTQLYPTVPNLTIKDIKLKIQNMRGQYRKELRKLEKVGQAKDGLQKQKKRIQSLWSYDLLYFLKPVLRLGEKRGLNASPEPGGEAHLTQDNWSDTASSIHSITKDSAVEAERNESGVFVSQWPELKKQPERAYSWLGEQVVVTINSLQHEEIADEAVFAIQKMLHEYKLRDKNYTKAEQSFASSTPDYLGCKRKRMDNSEDIYSDQCNPSTSRSIVTSTVDLRTLFSD